MRLRFTIRDLLWLTALIALAIGWWLDHRQLADALKCGFEVKVTEVREAEKRAESAATFLDNVLSGRIMQAMGGTPVQRKKPY